MTDGLYGLVETVSVTLKCQVACARAKTLENQVVVDLKGNLGMRDTEAELLAHCLSIDCCPGPRYLGHSRQ